MRATDPRICAEPGCGRVIGAKNRTGYCGRHHLMAMRRDPAFEAKRKAAQRETFPSHRMRTIRAPHLDAMTPAELADYRTCMRAGGMRMAEALAAIGRPDLIRAASR